MSNENDGWGTVEVSENSGEDTQVAFEIEEEENQPIVVEEEFVEEQKVEAEEPKELEGIETKGAEKRIRQLVRQRKEREERIDALILQNEELKLNINKKENEVNNIASRSVGASEKQLTQNIELARQAYLQAFDEGDKEKVLSAQEILTAAQSDLKTVQGYKASIAQRIQLASEKEEEEVPTQRPTFDPKANEWAERNEWFGQDTVKTAAALALDAELKGEGYDPNDEEFYQEIDQRLKKAFGQSKNRVQETEEQSTSDTSQPAQVVSGASRSSPSSNKKVKLSKKEVNLANKWGVPLEQYAAEKLKVTQADGEYTNVNT
jgi:hypothetical protein|tara:strand:- start:116 stop:1075 length:960 start_codon:yes stop_codon:yes gene_type:complete